MTGLTNFLAPYAHLLYANRNFAIVVLCGLLAWTTGNLFVSRWRQQRLQRDLADAKSSGSGSSGRNYSTPSRRQMEEPPMESGGLPPVKGGRSYARNLGPALQKAGVSGPQIYSPPPPPGWVTNANAGQSPAAPPPAPTPYATPNTPWGSPQPPPAAPWGFPAAGGRPMAPVPPTQPAPFYQPPPQAPQSPIPSGAGPGSVPLFGPPSAPGYGSAPMSPLTNVPPAGAPPAISSPGFPGGPSMPPTFGMPGPGMGIPGPPEDPSQRGKPKRRRFNFNVLENLEKMVAPKPPEPSTTDSAAAFAPAGPVAPPPTPSPTTTPPLVPIVPSAPASTGSAPPEFPRVPALTPLPESLPLSFGRPAETKPWTSPVQEKVEPEPQVEPETHEATETPEPVAHETEPVAIEPELPVFGSTRGEEPEVAEAKPEPVAEPEVERKRSSTSSMRSMLFGEEKLPPITRDSEPEPTASTAPEPEPEATASAAPEPESEPEAASPSSFRSRWLSRDEDFMKALEETAAANEQSTVAESTTEDVVSAPIEETPRSFEPIDEEPPASTVDAPAPVHDEALVQAPEEAPADTVAEPVAETHPVPVDEAPIADIPEPPATDGHDKPSAGTLLIIEDDKTAASYYETLFKGNGYRVEVANDGVSGVDLATRVQPDVILLDVMMPRQNGILVLQTLRASDETKNTPVVVMSNFSEPTLIKRALQLGALEYVIKTQVEGPALITAVPRWMNREKAFAAAA